MGARRSENNLSSRVQLDMRLNTRRSISYLQAPVYYSIYYINLAQFFQKVNIPKVISGHMCLIRYQNTCVLIRHFSVAKIPITHCSLYNIVLFQLLINNGFVCLALNFCLKFVVGPFYF